MKPEKRLLKGLSMLTTNLRHDVRKGTRVVILFVIRSSISSFISPSLIKFRAMGTHPPTQTPKEP